MQDSKPKPGERVKNVQFTDDTMAVDLIDGRTIVVPLAWYPRLLDATSEQRRNRLVGGAGYGIHWPDLDEDLSTAGLLRGAPAAPEPVRTRAQSIFTDTVDDVGPGLRPCRRPSGRRDHISNTGP
jgi:hypothetical protein